VFDTPLIIRKAACSGLARFGHGEVLQFSPKEGVGLIFSELPAAILRLQNRSFAGWAGGECISAAKNRLPGEGPDDKVFD
jgi:hypothetical protein